MQLAENIKRLRKEKGWSQAELAEKVGVHLTHINRIETGKYNPSLETVIELAGIFEVPLDYLVHSTDGSLEEIKLQDQSFAQRIKLLNSLDEEDRHVINKVIDAMLTKKRMLELLTKNEEELIYK